jgi:hypothetical protein
VLLGRSHQTARRIDLTLAKTKNQEPEKKNQEPEKKRQEPEKKRLK